ncbi:Hypothetical predicted protein [Cloeon dipterum]|uniref:Uncharacterized protein n=2 Tax=Cloeon dipterum TaxID=197152 RepID=A0A8S1EBQ1_9INSE|nr:Hypothetical predicted protein [Cloeon dipterum]
MCPRPRRSGAQLSRLSVLLGVAATATMALAVLTNVWIFTHEPVRMPNSDATVAATFKIGFWKVCSHFKRGANMTRREYPLRFLQPDTG